MLFRRLRGTDSALRQVQNARIKMVECPGVVFDCFGDDRLNLYTEITPLSPLLEGAYHYTIVSRTFAAALSRMLLA